MWTSVSCLSHAPHPRYQARIPGMCPDWDSNWRPFTLWDKAQPTKPYRPGPWESLGKMKSLDKALFYFSSFTPSHGPVPPSMKVPTSLRFCNQRWLLWRTIVTEYFEIGLIKENPSFHKAPDFGINSWNTRYILRSLRWTACAFSFMALNPDTWHRLLSSLMFTSGSKTRSWYKLCCVFCDV